MVVPNDLSVATSEPLLTIGADRVAGAGAAIEVENPATEKALSVFGSASLAQADAAVAAARAGFDYWRRLAPRQRAEHLHAFADAVERDIDALGASIVNEVGTPISLVQAAQGRLAVDQLRWFADAAGRPRVDHYGATFAPVESVSQVEYRPVGVVVAIAAYNYPLTIAILKIGAALAAGCSVVLMPSPRAPLVALRLGELALSAGVPAGVINVVAGGPEIGRHLVRHSGTDKVSFTGSVPVGSEILVDAAPHIKGVTLELGGKGAAIMYPDADLVTAVQDANMRWARNAGQVCTAPTRLLVHESRLEEFVEVSRASFESLVVGDPWDSATVIGPLITADHRSRVQGYVDDAVAGGGEILAAGTAKVASPGWFMNPVLLGGLAEDAPAVQQEIFGPVAVVQTFADDEDAIRIANSTAFGLSAAVYTQDRKKAMAVAEFLRAGTVWINGGGALRPEAAFGGFGASGLGREQGEYGVLEFLEPQHVQWRV